MEMIKEALTTLFVTILCGAISVATGYITIYSKRLTEKAKAETAKIESEAKRKLANDAIERLDHLVTANVVKMEQTVVKEIKRSSADNKIEKEELMAVAEKVKCDVLKQLTTESKDLIKIQIEDINSYIETQIEYSLAAIKNQILQPAQLGYIE